MLGGVFVVAPDGKIEDLEPEEAARRPELARTGRIFPDTQARRIQDAYQYKGGLWNAWFVHEDQTRITDTEINRQPYLVDFGEDGLGTQWVTVAEPYGRAFAASAIFLTDATTGRTRIWRVPARTSLSGNRRAIQAVKAVSIPGIDFGDETPGSGNFRVVEPRPVFVDGRLVYLTSIIPNSANAVSKTVIVDAETNKLVAIFDNDRDPQAEEKTLRYIETGEVPDEAAAPGATHDRPAGDDDARHDDDPRHDDDAGDEHDALGHAASSAASTTSCAASEQLRAGARATCATRCASRTAAESVGGSERASASGRASAARHPRRAARAPRAARRSQALTTQMPCSAFVSHVSRPASSCGQRASGARTSMAALARDLEQQRARDARQRALVGRRAERRRPPTTAGC